METKGGEVWSHGCRAVTSSTSAPLRSGRDTAMSCAPPSVECVFTRLLVASVRRHRQRLPVASDVTNIYSVAVGSGYRRVLCTPQCRVCLHATFGRVRLSSSSTASVCQRRRRGTFFFYRCSSDRSSPLLFMKLTHSCVDFRTIA